MAIPGSGNITGAMLRQELGLEADDVLTSAQIRLLAEVALPDPLVLNTDIYDKHGIDLWSYDSGNFPGFTTQTFTVPSDAQAGDFAILCDTAMGSSSGVIPTGWTSLGGASASFGGGLAIRCNCSAKLLTASDPGKTFTGQDGALRNRKQLCIIRTKLPIVSWTKSSWTVHVDDGAPASIAVGAAGTPNKVVVGFGHCQNTAPFSVSAGTGARTFAETNAASTTRCAAYGFTKLDGSPTNYTFSLGDGGDVNAIAAGTITFTF